MLLFLILIFLVSFIFYHFYLKRRGLPPGPTPLPFFGNLLSLDPKKPAYDVLLKWRKQYGPVYTYWFGETPVVAVNDFPTIKETFIKDGDSYAGRNFFTEFQKLMRGGKLLGVLPSEDELWKNHRRFALYVLRNFGMGRTIIEDIIMVEVNRLLKTCDQALQNGLKEHDLTKITDICIGSIINKMLFGYRFEGDTEHEFYQLKSIMNENLTMMQNPLAFLLVMMKNPSMLKNIPPFAKIYNGLLTNMGDIQKFLDRQIAWHKRNFTVDGLAPEDATNYVQAYLIEMSRREEKGDVGDFTYDQLRNMCKDMWEAGQETTTLTTNFGLLYIMMHPKVQEKLQAELDQVVGSARKVGLNDRPNLPYTQAVLNEVQRLTNLLPQNIFHKTTKDVIINGYKIPESTSIVPQISCVLYDESVFPDPYTFNPERFIDTKGQLKRVEELIPFSVGKRQCLGESMAKNELFLFLANLFHEFKVTPVNKNQTMEKINGFGVQPHPYKCFLERRIPEII